RIAEDMENHLLTGEKSLIVESNISTGKTAIILNVAKKIKNTVVIMVPPTVIPHWYQEILKMYGQLDNIAIIPYLKATLQQKCRAKHYDPSAINYKIVIITSYAKVDILNVLTHSVVIQDEVHKRHTLINHPRFM